MQKLVTDIDNDLIGLAHNYKLKKIKQIETMLQSIDSISIVELKSFGHKLRGTAGSFGLNDVTIFAKNIEDSDHKGHIKQLLIEIRSILLNSYFEEAR